MKHQSALLFLMVGLISLTGTAWADDAAPASTTSVSTNQVAPTPQPTMASKPAPAKGDSPTKAAMKAAGDLASAGKTDEAIAAYEKIGVLKSKKAEGWRLNNEGLAYLEATEPQAEKAVPVLQKAVDTDSSNYIAWNNLGSAYELTDQFDKAKDAYQKSIDAAKAGDAGSDKAEANLQALQAKMDKLAAKKGGSKADEEADSSAASADKGASAAPAAGADASK